MFRYRRYRAFLVFAVIAVLALYKFGASGVAWREAASHAVGAVDHDSEPRPAVAHETKSLKLHVPAATKSQSIETPPPVKKPSPSPSLSPSPTVTEQQQKPTIPSPKPPHPPQDKPAISDNGLDSSTSIEVIHWTKLPERFPVPSKSLIQLPSGKPKPIPKIQAKFKPEDAMAKKGRIAKLEKIKRVAKKSWDGYKEYAWLHDELRPQSGTFKDPFANWGATLVDSLDTLWIMGLKEEFEDAVKAVDKIDFTTTMRAEIPMFETTIRYLGGLVAAYDLSDKKYQNLLDKAVELAEVLISAFDTPNHMPKMYYYWRAEFASQNHRADQRAVLAEIGSLSMEFTRLAQLTGEHKYYDAIARITDHLEEFQSKTKLPGMWPTYLDASGCGKPYVESPSSTEKLSPEGKKFVPLNLPDPVMITSETGGVDLEPKGDPISPKVAGEEHNPQSDMLSPSGKTFVPLNLPNPVLITSDNGVDSGASADSIVPGTARKEQTRSRRKSRQLNIDENPPPKAAIDGDTASPSSSADASMPTTPECVQQGFVSVTGYGREEFTLGGMSDSTYEYLPKQYLLLGAQVEKYRTMYEQSMDVVKKHLLFRPMLPNGQDILFSGKLNVPSNVDDTKVGDLTAENAHLTCFTGGMFGMGAKLFDRPEDLVIAKKLTEGCIWSYSMTPTGIMPESFDVVPCENTNECAWNETAYWDAIDPQYASRKKTHETQMEIYKEQMISASSWYAAQLAAMTAPPTPSATAVSEAQATSTLVYADTLDRRQLADLVDEAEIGHKPSPSVETQQDHDSVMGGEPEEGEGPPTKVQPTLDIAELALQPSMTLPVLPNVYSPGPFLDHKEYVQTRIQENRLPHGVTRIGSRNYILRPEAIESVWYMYRITGDPYWREAGWRMFLAIDQHTSTEYGNSAIDDVTKVTPELNDDMESFWLAETLKYFYLLFADEDLVSLDEWVLNTEAHPFRRPT